MDKRVADSTGMPEREAFTVAELARAYRLSKATLYNIWRDGGGPQRMRVRGRVLISREAAETWRRRVESQTEAA